ncbi:Hypothetical_protein [Hexamita inflata]|uniref:Hypothetical_protein n=1 Tax=Hexamita inflata TaxID=28002 RepID=A0AA86NK42_9EUKA|nr:Hypothetical protein HINF_LOCUS8920 [Hexamita inflata]CAI9967455.1 Hypothetical protein HINF_LOCUS55100 [Hexamita inflata]
MGCSPTASSPESKEWFRSIFQNDILKIQHLKQFCTGSYNNNVTALHLSIVLNRFQIFSEVLDEINLLTKKSCSINGIKIEAESSAFQIAIQTCRKINFSSIQDYLFSSIGTILPYASYCTISMPSTGSS